MRFQPLILFSEPLFPFLTHSPVQSLLLLLGAPPDVLRHARIRLSIGLSQHALSQEREFVHQNLACPRLFARDSLSPALTWASHCFGTPAQAATQKCARPSEC